MPKKVLLVGLEYTGAPIPDTTINTLGLCQASVCPDKAAYTLYDYDVIIINPASYSHFLFGGPSAHSSSATELWDLKAENNDYDLDTAYDGYDRQQELKAALNKGTRVIWLMGRQKHTKFFGLRSIYSGYANATAKKVMESARVREKKSRQMTLDLEVGPFKAYFDRLRDDGWTFCLSDYDEDKLRCFAASLEGYCIGGHLNIGDSVAWLLTPPTSQAAANVLVACALDLEAAGVTHGPYHGIFLSHTSDDKPFVRELKARLEAHGVRDIWLDEAEILVGDSLTKKIEEGLQRTKYIGVVLSPRSINSPWVERELEIAINREIDSGEVVVLPLLYEHCELPAFLRGKLYADFTSPADYDASIEKLLRRLKIQ